MYAITYLEIRHESFAWAPINTIGKGVKRKYITEIQQAKRVIDNLCSGGISDVDRKYWKDQRKSTKVFRVTKTEEEIEL